MPTYEEQAKKWASARYNLNVENITMVDITSESWVTEGCPTCGPTTDEYFDVYVHSTDNKVRSEQIRDLGFEQLLDQIIKA